MDQQPGHTYTPGNQQQNQPAFSGEAGDHSGAAQSAANQEIAEIDDAVRNAPSQPTDQDVQAAGLQTFQQPENAGEPEAPRQNQTRSPQPVQDDREQLNADDMEPVAGEPLLVWEAAEPEDSHAHNAIITLSVFVIAALVIGAIVALNGINFSTITSIIVTVLAVIAIILANRQYTHLETYAIYDSGVSIGQRFYEFSRLRAFTLTSFGNAASVELEPTERFMVRRVMHLDNGNAERAIELLSQRLPYEERSQGVIDQISNKLRL